MSISAVQPGTADLSRLTCTVPVFEPDRDRRAVPIGTWTGMSQTAAREVARRLDTAGFALIQANDPPDGRSVPGLASAIGLGAVFNPPIYRDRPYVDALGVTTLRAEPLHADHPAFQSPGPQALHCDGTLERIGEIKTSVLLCVAPARSGGASLLFNSAGAFGRMLIQDPPAAAAMTAAEMLVRTSGLRGIEGHSGVGPAFAIAESRLISRYSVSATDVFDRSAVADPAALERAIEFLADAARSGSPFAQEITLAAGQGLIMVNDAISHGRRAYEDDPGRPRTFLRAMFKTRRKEPWR